MHLPHAPFSQPLLPNAPPRSRGGARPVERALRILYVSDLVPPVIDGVSRTLLHLVASLEESGAEFLFVSAGEPEASLSWRHRVHGVPAARFPLNRSYRVGVPIMRASRVAMDEFAPDLVHVVTPSLLGVYGLRYGLRRRLPVVASFHTNFPACLPYYGLGGLERLSWRYLRWFYRQCTLTLAPSRIVANELQARGVPDVAVWPRGVDARAFSPSFRDLALRRLVGATESPILLYVGRLVREKRLDDLVEAARLLHAQGDPFKLVIVGDGPMRAELRARLPHAHFTGHVEGEALSRWYASADIFVLPSTVETFGNVVLEAFASGLPVIAADQGGVTELVTHAGNGLRFSAGEPAALAGAIRRLVASPDEVARLGRHACLTAARHRWPEINRRLFETYTRLIARRAPP